MSSITDIAILNHMSATSSPLRRLLVEHSAALAEIAKLRAEVETMRPAFVASLAWFDAPHVYNANHAAGDCDECPARDAENRLRVVIAEVNRG